VTPSDVSGVPVPGDHDEAAATPVPSSEGAAAPVDPRDPTAGVRRLSVWAYLGIVLGFMLVTLVATFFTVDKNSSEEALTENADLVRQLVRLAPQLLYVCGVIVVLRWWRPVLVDRRPVRRWVWGVPAVMALTIVVCTNYSGLREKPLGFVVLLLVYGLAIGAVEELLFRGIGVTAFRINGYREGRVALWTSVVFALSHAAGGPIQVIATLAAGYLFYLVRRVSGGLLLAVVVHGFWDFSILSAGVVGGETYRLVPVFILVEVGLALLLVLVGRRRIEPV
jgi:membrane protease YdiL (CAAX protease family)